MRRIGSPWPRPPGQLRGVEREDLAVRWRATRIFDGRLGEERDFQPVVALEGQRREIRRRGPSSRGSSPSRDTTTVTGSRSIIASARSMSDVSGASAKLGAPPAELVSAARTSSATSRISPGDRLPLPVVGGEQRLDRRLLLGEVVLLALRAPSPRAGAGCAGACRGWRSACSSVRLKTRISSCFGSSSSRMIRITSSRLR